MTSQLEKLHAQDKPGSDLSRFFLNTMIIAREADSRENALFRQGRGQLHVSSAGHEAIVGLAPLIKETDAVYSYYRDRPLMLGLGVTLYELALDYFAKAESSSAGRQMANHYSYKKLNIIPAASPTGLQCLPAAGTAWGFKKKGSGNVVFCFMGEASTRQGEFFEALSFALQEKLPVIFVVEDNGYGISTPTSHLTPLNLNLLPKEAVHVMDGRDPMCIHEALSPIVESARLHNQPKVVWLKLDRLMSHTSSDDHAKYRAVDELDCIRARDPLVNFKNRVIAGGTVTKEELSGLEEDAKSCVRNAYAQAEQAPDPESDRIYDHVFSPPNAKAKKNLDVSAFPEAEWRMSKAINSTLDLLLRENNKVLLFGEDIEDPKGGVFGLTRTLSCRYPGRVINSPLAEATIAGVASGLSLAGFMPVFELQFIDFVGPAFHQIVNQIATLRWRSAGKYGCPLVLYAPCGGYISNGGPWHTQTNECWFAHTPGLKVYMPGNANDAAHMLYHAAHGQDPALLLFPKNQFQTVVPKDSLLRLHHEKARIKRKGDHITLVAWGNCVPLAMVAADREHKRGVSIEVIDLCSLVPCDWPTLRQSVRKTGRLVVIQEDGRTCSFGQSIISEIMTDQETWQCLRAAPQLVTKEDVYIGFNKNLEAYTLPNVEKVLQATTAVFREVI